MKDVTGIHFHRFLTFIDKGKNPEEGESKMRVLNPSICKDAELSTYKKELNDWAHLEKKELQSEYGSHVKYVK